MDGPRDRDIDSVNQRYSRFDQVRKDQTYRLAEGGPEEELYDEAFPIRTVDLRSFHEGGEPGRDQFARELGEALEEIGFAVLIGHGIDPALHLEAERRVQELFTECSLEEKLRFRAARHGSVSQGYFPIEETSEIHPDLVEGWVFCRRAFDLPDRRSPLRVDGFWPRPGLEPFFRRLCLAHASLILPLMQSILRYLGCDPHHLDSPLTGTNFGLRLNYYPPIGAEADASGAGRLLGHEDVDLLTILPAPSEEGLQVLNRRNHRWIRLAAPPGSIILNTGDYMQRISNDVLPSTTHRVSKPRDPGSRARARVSFPMAVYLDEDEWLRVLPGTHPGLQPPKYEPVRAIAFHTRATSKFYGEGYAVEE